MYVCVKNPIVTCENVCFDVKIGITEWGVIGSPKAYCL